MTVSRLCVYTPEMQFDQTVIDDPTLILVYVHVQYNAGVEYIINVVIVMNCNIFDYILQINLKNF